MKLTVDTDFTFGLSSLIKKKEPKPESFTMTANRVASLMKEGIDVTIHERKGNVMRITINAYSQRDLQRIFYAGTNHIQDHKTFNY